MGGGVIDIIKNSTSTTSRVVPGTADTIATFRSARWFITRDLPAFGSPTMARLAPLRIFSPRRASLRCSRIVEISCSTRSFAGMV